MRRLLTFKTVIRILANANGLEYLGFPLTTGCRVFWALDRSSVIVAWLHYRHL